MAMRRDMAATIAQGGRAQPGARALPQFFGALPAPGPPQAAGRLFNGSMENELAKRPAVPLLVLLAMASALGVAVAIALAAIAMLLAAPAYAGEGSLLLERRGAMAEAERVSAEVESRDEGEAVMTRVVEVYHNPFAETLKGVYLYRLPPNVMLERLSFTPEVAAARPALLTTRQTAALVERTEALGPGETLSVELVYRTRSVRRVLALRQR
jgi:hypothetical protein